MHQKAESGSAPESGKRAGALDRDKVEERGSRDIRRSTLVSEWRCEKGAKTEGRGEEKRKQGQGESREAGVSSPGDPAASSTQWLH
jgi:hypothetical protein